MNDEKKYKHVGWFSEISQVLDSKPITDYITDKIQYDREEVLQYLRSFRRIAFCPKRVHDLITGNEIATHFNIFCDGEYSWPDYLIYYVEKYNIRLPEDFLDKIQKYSANG